LHDIQDHRLILSAVASLHSYLQQSHPGR
jgi:hypothetical protein